jgi:hypothetical protein
MKKSELKKYIKAEIVNELSIGEATIETAPENLDKVKQKADKDDVIRVTEENIGLADLEETGYEDGEKSVAMHFNQDVIGINSRPDFFAYRKGFVQAVVDSTKSYEINEDEDQEIDENESLEEMAKISGDLKSSIEKVMQDNPNLEMLPLKKAIKADADVIKALGDGSLYDNQLGKFISAAKGEREIGQRGRKLDPNVVRKPKSPTGKVGRPGLSNAEKIQKLKNKDNTKTFSIGKDKKYYSTKKVDGVEADGPTDAELRQLAKSGKKIEKSKEAQLKLQEKSKLVKAFLNDMKNQGIVDTANRIVDKEKYDSAWSITKPEIEAAVKNFK